MTEEFVGYENLISFVEGRGLASVEGDIVEIGAYMGGGTVKLAEFAKKHRKKVYAVDTFDTSLDGTMSKRGVPASEVYEAFLYGQSMFGAYQETTEGYDNIVTIRQDSRLVSFPGDLKLVFAFIDGCHQGEYVESDFRLVWPHIVSGGVVGFHDYRFDDWPEVTVAVDSILMSHGGEILETHELEGAYGVLSLLVVKR